jgi:hypothetical protein
MVKNLILYYRLPIITDRLIRTTCYETRKILPAIQILWNANDDAEKWWSGKKKKNVSIHFHSFVSLEIENDDVSVFNRFFREESK